MIDVEYPICRFARNSFDHAKPIRLFSRNGKWVCESSAVGLSSEKQIFHAFQKGSTSKQGQILRTQIGHTMPQSL